LVLDLVKQNNPSGGFVRKDPSTGRWFRIKDLEARDKVGHAIRKAVQRLEETKPKLATRLKMEQNGKQAGMGVSSSEGAVKQQQSEEPPHKFSPKGKGTSAKAFGQGGADESMKPSAIPKLQLNPLPPTGISTPRSQSEASDALRNIAAMSQSLQYNLPHGGGPSSLPDVPTAAQLSQAVGVARSPASAAVNSRVVDIASLLADQHAVAAASMFPLSRYGYGIDSAAFLSPSLITGRNTSRRDAISTSSPYDQLLALQLREHTRSTNTNLAIIRALQQQEEANLSRDIEYTSRRLIAPTGSNSMLDRILPFISARSQVVSANRSAPSIANTAINPLDMASLQPLFERSSGTATLIAFNEALRSLGPQQQNQPGPPGDFNDDA
jgi:hypothetical protein